MNIQIRILERVLSPGYEGLSPIQLASEIFESPKLTIDQRLYVGNIISQMIKEGLLKTVDLKVMPTDATQDYYENLMKQLKKD
ncbi:hypothetical protein ACFLTH_07215 [Bacteroidota bacterium]